MAEPSDGVARRRYAIANRRADAEVHAVDVSPKAMALGGTYAAMFERQASAYR